ncbi:hypothetical protein HPP92_008970 [Vanilla planifolia]|uniref:Uncharacterized protein n=1 Tax=Vanilla planifolia TaxID=51239 RepID=A0A835R7C2_VANPL|nr:hypothetical protein HPP92_008970 [Vanilla planifolia]
MDLSIEYHNPPTHIHNFDFSHGRPNNNAQHPHFHLLLRPHVRRSSPLLASVQRTAAPRLAAAPNSLTLKLSSAESPKPSSLSLPTMWRDIQGADDWEALLEPLHPLLRREIVRYGELVSACYKAFDLDPSSKRYLNCKYGKTAMLREVGMASAGYRITKYIYANPDIAIPTQSEACPSRWIGYVAVATDEAVARPAAATCSSPSRYSHQRRVDGQPDEPSPQPGSTLHNPDRTSRSSPASSPSTPPTTAPPASAVAVAGNSSSPRYPNSSASIGTRRRASPWPATAWGAPSRSSSATTSPNWD